MNVLLMAVWRRQLKQTVAVHSNQTNQSDSYDPQDFLKVHNLETSMSQHDNAVAESLLQVLKQERICKSI